MGRDTKAASKLGKKRRPKGASAKLRSAPKAERGRRSSGANRDSKVARLTRELGEALQRQAATADILKVIASSPTDTQPVFEAIVVTAVRLLRCDMSFVMLCDPPAYWVAAAATPEGLFDELTLIKEPIDPSANFPSRTIVEQRVFYLPDWSLIDLPEHERHIHETVGVNSALYLPLMREGECIGLLTLGGKQANIFGESEIALAESFRDQALIAIENARLFNEVQAKSNALAEALTYQTASGNILGVIASSPTTVEPALQAIAESACKLCDSYDGGVLLKIGDDLYYSAHHGPIPIGLSKNPISRRWVTGRCVVDKTTLQVSDLLSAEGDDFPEGRDHSRRMGHRCILAVPLLRQGEAIGAIALRRLEPVAFSEKQISVLQTFADQAVIAIENARLFNETKEALEQQTATSDVLQIISKSTFNLEPVFRTLVENAARLCGAQTGMIFQSDGGLMRLAAAEGASKAFVDYVSINPIPPSRGSATGRAALEGRTVHVLDVENDPDYAYGGRSLERYRTIVAVPLMRGETAVGSFTLWRHHVQAFTPRQIALVETFADQAVVAIENVRLFNETKEALERQTATADILNVIASSPDDVQPVFEKILRSIEHLFGADERFVLLAGEDGLLHIGAVHGPNAERLRALFPVPLQGSASEVAIRERRLVTHGNVLNDTDVPPVLREVAHRFGNNYSMAVAPMLWDDRAIGSIFVGRTSMEPFSEKECSMLRTFSDQAVIAIQNARMFEQVQAKTRELSQSLDDLRAAQDRLIQTEKLASLGQLTAGIAHEIKNPLNFVNNFSSLSAELVGEMNDVLAKAALDKHTRDELDDLAQMLKDNLEKVVRHGKRADSIVKNMLLHSREGSGERRHTDINALVEESLNLAYHGARAEKTGFKITLQRDFDPGAGELDIFPQEITRVFLNLISNGFYATAKRKAEAGDGFEPVLRATTRNLGDVVEIRIRDNGTGIPSSIKDKIFNPFFTTKPSGEGTGLGLSIGHDIVVKQHGGTIDVTTELGQFTEFTIVLPRSALAQRAEGKQK